MRHEKIPGPANTLRSFQELAAYWEKHYPETLAATLSEQNVLQRQLKDREKAVESKELIETLREYNIPTPELYRDEEGYYRLPLPETSSAPKLPDGYGYKGGVARFHLRIALGLPCKFTPRDLDIIRLAPTEPYENADEKLSQKYMPDDFEHGYGVEPVDSTESYFRSRDLTINEVLTTETEIIATEQAILDIVRNILRPTSYTLSRWPNSRDKILAKIVRFYVQSIVELEQEVVIEVDTSTFERSFIPPFWLALNLERAISHSPDAAQEYVDKLVKLSQLPPDINTPERAAEYLTKITLGHPFYFRHADLKQFNIEDRWLSAKQAYEDELYDQQEDLERE